MKVFFLLFFLSIINFKVAAYAFDGRTLSFKIIPEESFLTYSPNIAPGGGSVTEQFEIVSGNFSVYIYTATCGTKYIRFDTSEVITDPLELPYGSFFLPTGVAGNLENNSFEATSFGWCNAAYCDFYGSPGSIQCMPGSFISLVSGSLSNKEMILSGVAEIKSSIDRYSFSIKAIQLEPERSNFNWELFMPAIKSVHR